VVVVFIDIWCFVVWLILVFVSTWGASKGYLKSLAFSFLEDWGMQGFPLAKQVLCHVRHASSPFKFLIVGTHTYKHSPNHCLGSKQRFW
jgi:hypothetical protein